MTSSSFSNIRSRGMSCNDPLQEKSPKKFRSTNNWLENKKLQNAFDETRSLLEEERVEKLGQLSQAEWIPNIQVAKVTKQVGRQWMTMGHSYLGDLVLYPEEALFLLETNTIEISFGGLPMSLQQAYSVLLGVDSSCTLEEYRAYAHLTRYGYKVRRHRQEQRIIKRRWGEEEVDVVGIIRKRKSCDVAKTEKLVEVEDSVQIIKPEIPHTHDVDESLPSTSGAHSTKNVVFSEDDDIKFIEVVDANKKRKVAGTIVINDDFEMTSRRVNEASQSNNKIAAFLNSKKEDLPGHVITAKQETAKAPSNTSCTSPRVELVDNLSSVSVNKPSRGMYHSKPLATLYSDKDIPESMPSANGQHEVIKDTSEEVKVQTSETSAAKKIKTGNDDVIVLSDDETKDGGEQAREIQRFYKEISLIELIDISDEDEGEKATSKSFNGKDRIANDNYDFWGVLGRIPTLKKGRLTMKIPAPPSNLIPINTRPVKDEYTLDINSGVDKPREGTNEITRPSEESKRKPDEDNNHMHISQQTQSCGGSSSHQMHISQQIQSRGGSSSHQMRISQQIQSRGGLSSHQMRISQQAQSREGSSSHQMHISQQTHSRGGSSSHQLARPLPSSSQNPWNSWQSRNNSSEHIGNVGNGYQFNSFSGHNYQANCIRSPWLSFVYPQRQSSYSFTTQFQAWNPPNFSSYYQNSQFLNYSQQQYQNFNVYRDGNRPQSWQSHSNHLNDRGSGPSWQQACAPRWGNGHHRRGNNISFRRRRNWNRPIRPAPVEAEKDNSAVTKNPDARNWSEIKAAGDRQKNTEPSDGCQTDNKEDILPLLRAADSKSIDAVHSKLQISKSAKFSCNDTSNKKSSSLSIKFDLYMPNSKFRKSCPGTPRYRLSVVKSDDRIPKLEDTLYLMKNLNDEVPLLFAVSFPENVNFFSFSNVDLPVQLAK